MPKLKVKLTGHKIGSSTLVFGLNAMYDSFLNIDKKLVRDLTFTLDLGRWWVSLNFRTMSR